MELRTEAKQRRENREIVYRDTLALASQHPLPALEPQEWRPKQTSALPKTLSTHFTRGDIIDVALRLSELGNVKPLVLFSIQDSHPGGSRSLDGTLEAMVYRRTNAPTGLRFVPPSFLPTTSGESLDMNGPKGIYCSSLLILKEKEALNYQIRDSFDVISHPLSFIAIKPFIQQQKQTQLHPKVLQQMQKKIELALQVAEEKGHEILVVTAFGCGSNKNPPKDVAKIFLDLITGWRSSNLRAVVFVMKEQSHKPDSITKVFLDRFKKTSEPLEDIAKALLEETG